jgi:serine/threonine protein kinase
MNDADERDVLAIVEACLDLSPAEREAVVHGATEGRPKVRERVRRMLDMASGKLPDTQLLSPSTADVGIIPERVGKFKINGLIGRGGRGVVLAAERDDGLYSQRVAIKLLRTELMDEQGRERFANERRLLARLNHPAIARILDGGDENGCPYLVMEYADGQPLIDALAESPEISAARLVEVFLAVAEATAEAHRQLVIHGDIKPGNVLLGPGDTIKLVDFGVARLAEELGSGTAAAHPLTPDYAAPERRSGAPPTIASDVFSLGKLLGEMLALLPESARPRDLEEIARRASAEDLAERYPDVAALLEDVGRYRARRPISARRHDRRYAAKLFLRRHWGALSIAGLFALVLVASTAVALILYADARHQRTTAEARFSEVRSLAKYQLFTFYDALAQVPGTLPARLRLAQEAQAYLDRLAAAPEAPADVRLETAQGYLRLAEIQGVPSRPNLDQSAAARANLDRAEQLVGEAPDTSAGRAVLAWARLFRADIATWQDNDGASGERWLREAEPLVAGLRDESAEWLALEKYRRTVRLAVLGWREQYEQEEGAARETLAWLDGLPPEVGQSAPFVIARAEALGSLGESLWYRERQREALADYRAADELLERAVAAAPAHSGLLSARMVSIYNLATSLQPLGERAPFVAMGQQMVELGERAQRLEPNDASIASRLRNARSMLAQFLSEAGRVREGIIMQTQLVEADQRRLAQGADWRTLRYLALDRKVLGTLLRAAGDEAGSCAAWRAALQDFDRLAAAGRLNDWDRSNVVAGLRRDLAGCG